MKDGRIIRSRLVLILVIISLTVVASKCGGENQKDLIKALIAACGDSTVFLGAWWSNTDDQSQIEIDPLGGYIFLYWIDQDGNACHGIPGVSGQPGPFVISAFDEGAFSAGKNNTVISSDQLDQFQDIPFELGAYSSEGMHFAQFANTIWRIRESGQAVMDRGNLHFSIPEIVSLNVEFCLVPIYVNEAPGCGPYLGFLIPTLNLEDGPEQHPDMCKVRLMPETISTATSERLDYCVTGLPHGLEITE